uniref:long-chain-fatty-acid--CoA ligase n=2 Tax=Schistosoma japonicum TaxID=6182 RepID=C7TXZ6_SCHJA|nr:Long-chain-fatty-acid--CoA ligase 5 [Schistosoma japonicum]
MPENRSSFPRAYVKQFKEELPDYLISKHLNRQSIICDPVSGARKSPMVTKFADKIPVKTMKDVFENGLNISTFYPCLGKRNSVNEPYFWLTYYEVDRRIQFIGSALLKIVRYKPNSENFVGIYGINSPEWIIMQHACAAYGYTVVPLYATLGDDAMQHVLSQTNMECILCASGTEALHLMDEFESSLKYLIIISNDVKVEEVKSRHSSRVSIYLFEDFMKLGMKEPLPKKVPLPTDLYMICYTSGSTGLPKGVLINHEQIVDSVFSLIESTENKLFNAKSSHLSYLPLAHIMEQIFSAACLMIGCRLGFITNSIENLVEDAKALKLGALAAVPRVLSRMYTKYQLQLDNWKLKKTLYDKIEKIKLAEQTRGKFNHRSLLDTLCFARLRKMFGESVFCIMCGGAPLPPDISKFVRAAFGLLMEGYGATETMGVISITLLGEYRTGTAGSVAYGVQVKLVGVPDLGLVALRDQRGEVCVKGKRCTKGYYKNPEETAKLYDNEGWLHTGDIGEWTPEGLLKIISRIKSVFKLAQGEYIAPEKIEMVYQHCRLINQIFVDGNSLKNYPVAIVVPDFTELRSSLNNTGVLQCSKLSDSAICQNDIVNKFLLLKMNAVATEKALKSFEKVQAIYLTDELFTVENGLLTPTMKLARTLARNRFRKTIDGLYT